MNSRSTPTGAPTRRGRRGLLAGSLCTAALLAGCTTASPADPSPSPSGSIGAEIPVDAVTALLPTDLQAELYFDMDQAAWQQMGGRHLAALARRRRPPGWNRLPPAPARARPRSFTRRVRGPCGPELVAGRRRAGRIQSGLPVRPPRDGLVAEPGRRSPCTAPPSSTPRRCSTCLRSSASPAPTC